VDPRFADGDWRSDQVYLGEAFDRRAARIHFIAPRPSELPGLMDAFLAMLGATRQTPADPVAWAAALSFGFVFLHPFQDGNGRVHRWLLHWVLAQRRVVPAGVVVPVSAVMLRLRADYDAALESFSRPLMRLLDFTLDGDGVVRVHSDLSRAYRYLDATTLAETLAAWLDEAVDRELGTELDWLTRFDRAKAAVAEVVDMPDRLVTLFIEVCLDHEGRLSKRKRERFFGTLSDEEIGAMEARVAEAFASTEPTMR